MNGRPLPLSAACVFVAAIAAPLTLLVWAVWFRQAAVVTLLQLLVVVLIIIIVVSLYIWLRAISSTR